jgi:RHS repeat-associated protein
MRELLNGVETSCGGLWIGKASTASNLDIPYRFTGKERDAETDLYYYEARYLDSKTGRWLSTDPALADYIPGAPVDDEARKRNASLPGVGGVFNTVNLHLYHYAGNNPVKYIDPDGRTDWDMLGKGLLNVYNGVGKIGTGLGIFAVTGASALLSSGTATPLAVLGAEIVSGLVANGWVKDSIGFAETLAGATSDPVEVEANVPETLNQMIGVIGDDIINLATGEQSTIMQKTADVIDTIQDEVGTKGTGRLVETFLTP